MSSENQESIIGKFFGVLGLKVDTQGIDQFKHELGNLRHLIEGVVAVEAVRRIVEFVEHAVGAAAAVNDFAEVTEMSATKVEALGRVAIEHSASIEAMRGAIMGVYRATGQAAMGLGRNVKLFQTLGISAKDSSGHVKSAETVMGKLADKFQTMDMAKVIATAGRLGIDPMIARAMKDLGSKGWAKEVADAMGKNLLSAADYAQADRTEKTFKKLHLVFGQITTLIANQLAPWVSKATTAFETFVTSNKVELTQKLHFAVKYLSEVLGRMWNWASKVWSVLAKVTDLFQKNRVAAEVFRAVIVGIVSIRLAAWLIDVGKALEKTINVMKSIPKLTTAFVLLVAAAGLLLEDWMSFQRGEESVIGDLEKRWPAAFKVISAAMRGLQFTWEAIVASAKVLGLVKDDVDEKGKDGTVQRYAYYRKHPPKVGTPEADEFVTLDRQFKSDVMPQLLMMQGATGGAPALQDLMAARQARGDESVPTSIPTVGTDKYGVTVYNTGTRIEIKADTDERARLAGHSVREALTGKTRIRNYQPRAL